MVVNMEYSHLPEVVPAPSSQTHPFQHGGTPLISPLTPQQPNAFLHPVHRHPKPAIPWSPASFANPHTNSVLPPACDPSAQTLPITKPQLPPPPARRALPSGRPPSLLLLLVISLPTARPAAIIRLPAPSVRVPTRGGSRTVSGGAQVASETVHLRLRRAPPRRGRRGGRRPARRRALQVPAARRRRTSAGGGYHIDAGCSGQVVA